MHRLLESMICHCNGRHEHSVDVVTGFPNHPKGEVVWVLESFYKLKRDAIGPMIKAILSTHGLKVINSSLVEKAIDYYLLHNIDFIDGYIAAVMEKKKIDIIFSYDKKHLSCIQSVNRKEP